jgi:hypothetical protein
MKLSTAISQSTISLTDSHILYTPIDKETAYHLSMNGQWLALSAQVLGLQVEINWSSLIGGENFFPSING